MHPRLFLHLLAVMLLAGMLSGCAKKDNASRFLDLANKHFDAGEYEKAKAEYMNVIRLEPGNSVALKQLGLIWMEQGAPRRAAPFLAERVSRAPTDAGSRTKLLTALMELQDYSRAHHEAATILKLDPANEDALVHLAASAGRPQQIEAAKRAIAASPAPDSAAVHLAMCHLLVKARDLDSAEGAVRKGLRANPKSITAHLLLSGILELKKSQFAAEDEFKILSELAPLRSPERLALADFKFRHGAVGEARVLVDKVTGQAADYIPALILSARLAAAVTKCEDAHALLRRVAEIDSDNFGARLLQADVFVQEGRVKESIDILEKLLKDYPGNPRVQYFLAKSLVNSGEPGKAQQLLTQAVSAAPQFDDAVLLLAGLHLQRGESHEVIALVGGLLKKQPGFVPAILMQSVALQKAGRPSEGAALVKDLVTALPNNPEYRSHLGILQRDAGELKEARQSFEETLKRAPDDLNAVSQLIELDIVEKRFDDALQRAEKALEKSPGSSAAHALKGRIFSSQQKWDEAEAALQKAVETDPKNIAAGQQLIRVYIDAKKLPQALDQVNQWLAKQPENTQALLTAGLICEAQREYAKARDHYEKLLTFNPDAAEVMNNLACLYVEEHRLNDPGKAFELAKKARSLRPPADASNALSSRLDSAAVADTLGWIHYKRGEYREAADLCREATRELGDNPEVQYHFAMAAAMMGEMETARASLTSALKPGTGLPDDFPGRNGIQARLDLMGGSGTPAKVVSSAELEAAAKKEPNDPMVQYLLGMACEQEKDFPRAAKAYEKAAELNPVMAAAIINLARLSAGPQNDPKKALELAKKARQLAPDDALTAGVLGGVAFKAGDYPWAYDLLSQGKRAATPGAGVLRDLAWAAYSLGKVAEARENMQAVLSTFADSPEAAAAKPFLVLTSPPADDRSETELAAAAEDALKSDPGNVPALMLRARSQARNGETAPAIAGCTAILKRFPDFTPAQVLLASLYAHNPETRDKAWELATKVRDRETPPFALELVETLAALSYYKKDYAYGIQLLEPEAAKNTLSPHGFYYLGAAQFSVGDKPASRKSLTSALAGTLPESVSAHARQMLTKLGPE